MQGIPAWWHYLGRLTKQTFHVWWRVLPKILAAWTGGWLVLNMTMVLTAPLQQDYPWLVVVLFSFGLVGYLAGIIVAIRFAGEPDGLWDRLPPDAVRIGRDESLLRVLSQTLLPFVGVYSVFGGIQDATYKMFIYGSRAVGEGDAATLLLDPKRPRERLVMIAVLVFCYLLRRCFEAIAERTRFVFFGVLGAMTEGVFSVVLIFGGSRMLGDLGGWMRRREFWGWLLQIGSWLAERLALIHDLIPDFIGLAWNFVFEQVWPLFSEGIMAPLLWLAVAGLTYGTYTLSAADLWQRDAASRASVTGRGRLLAALRQRGRRASSVSRTVTLEFAEVFAGDLEDRIIPFVQSLRHILKVGLPFMGAYVLLYAVSSVLPALVWRLVWFVFGGRKFEFWFRMDMPVDLAAGLFGEPIRLCLLAVAMALTVAAARERSEDGNRIATGTPGPVRPGPAGDRARISRALPLVAVTVASLLASGALVRALPVTSLQQSVRVPAGESQWLYPGEYLSIDQLRAGKQITRDGRLQPMLQTRDLFLAVDVWVENRTADAGSLECRLQAGPKSGLSRPIPPVESSSTSSPGPGFGRIVSLVFERPADALVGSAVRCQVFELYHAHERVLVLDLGIDAERQTQLANRTGPVEVPAEYPEEVLQ